MSGLAKAQVFELFPVPMMRVERVVDAAAAGALALRFGASPTVANARSDELAHSRLLDPAGEPLLRDLADRIAPHLVEFGALLFGERLRWCIKELWVNVMQPGGRQSLHNHANCFASGVLYLSECDPASNTVFVRSLGGRDYVFANTHAGAEPGKFNADKWIGPPPAPGDLLLFPSYLLHEVPANRGAARTTLAFNAIPDRVDAWGYSLTFAP